MSNAQKSNPLSVLILGAGKIAGQLDEARRGLEPITHAGAFAAHSGFRLMGCVDPDTSRRRAFQEHWNIPHGFSNLDEALGCGHSFDVVSVCTPSSHHATDLEKLHGAPIKLVFTEKPLTDVIDSARNIARMYAQSGPLLAVNYNRRWNSTFIQLSADIASGDYGHFLTGHGYYTKGILNNGSHLVDLLDSLLGPLTPVRVTRTNIDWNNENDPTLDAEVHTQNGAPIRLIGADARAYFMFEFTLVFEKGAISVEDGGTVLRVRPLKICTTDPAQNRLARGTFEETNLNDQFPSAVQNLHDALTQGSDLRSTPVNALRAQELCTTLLTLSKTV